MLNEFGEETSGVLEGIKPGVRETPTAAGAFTRAAQRAAYDSAAESLLEEDEARISEFVFSPTEEMRGRLEYARLDARARQMVADPDAFQDEEMGAVFKELNARRFVADERTMKAFDILDGVPEGGKANAARLDEFLKFTDALGAAKTTEEQQRMLDERFASDELKAWRAAETADGKTERETLEQYATEEEARAVAGFGGSAFSYEPEADAQGNVKHFVKQTHPVEYGSTANRAKIAREWLEKNGRQFGDKVASLRNFVGNPNDWLDSAFGGNPKGKGFGERLGERGVGTWLTDAQAIKEYERHVAGERMRAEAAKVMPFLTVQQKELVNLAASGADMDEFRGVFKLMNAEDREMMLSMVQAVRPEADLNWFTDSAYRVFSGVRGGLRGGGRAIQAGWSAIFDSPKERAKLKAEMLEDIHWAEAAGDLKLKDPTSFVEKALSGWSDSASLQFSMLGGEMLKRGGAAIPGWGGKAAVGAGYAMEAYGALSMIGEQFDNMLLNGIDIERAAPLAVCGGLIDAWVEKWNLEAYMGLKISPADMKRVGIRAALRASLKMDGKEFLKVMRTNAKQALTIAATECMEEMVQGWNREGWLGLAEGRGAIDSFASSKAYGSAFESLVEAIPACTAFGVFGAANVTGTVRKGAHGAYLEHLAGISSAVARRNGIDTMRKNGEAIAQRAALNEAARVAEATKGMTARERRVWINAQSEFTVSEKAFYNEHCEYVEASIAQTGREWTEARLSGSVNEAMWARSGWRFMHDDAGRITAVESKTGERWDVDAVNREAKLEDFTDERLAAFIAEWNEEVANGTLEGAKALPAAATRAEVEQWTAEDRERLTDAIARMPGWYEGGKIRLFTGLADNATLGHELTHGFLDRLERVNNREARKAIRALKASFGAWWNEAAAHRVEDSIAADVLRYEEETAGGERVDARAVAKNLVTAVRKAVGLGKGRAFLPVYRTAEGREISPDVAFGSVVAESLAAYAARMETERKAAEARRALREKHRAEREAKRQRKIQMRMAARGLAVDGAQGTQAQGTQAQGTQTGAQAQGTAQTGAGVQTQGGNAQTQNNASQTQNNVSQTQTAAIPQSGLWRLGATGQFSGGNAGTQFSIMSREVDEEIAAEERAEMEELEARFAGELAMLAEDGGAADGRTARAEEERLERAEERMRERRAEAVRTMPRLAEPNGAYGAAWRALTGGALEDADVAGLREEYGLSPEAVNLERGADGKWRLGGAGTQFSISARELEGLERLRRDVGSARIAVADVVAATAEEAAEAVPNVAYDPVSNTFIEGRIVVDPSAAERVERGAEGAPSVSPEEIMRSRGERDRMQFSIAGARRSVNEALARDENGHYKVSGGKGVRFADSLPILEFLGIRANGIFTIAERVRKMETKHFMTEEQIARLAEFCENPVAVFEGIDDMGGIVILTDELAPCAKGGPLKPIMVLLRPEKGGDGGFVASAYSRKPDKESAYVAMRSKLRFLDKNKVAGIRLEGETLSLLEPQASGNSVLTAEDYSSWRAMGNVPQSGGEVNRGVAAAPADPGKAGHFSIMGRSAERVATLYLAREMMENGGRIPDSRKIQALARRVGYNGSLNDLVTAAEAEAKTQTQLLRTIASDPKTEKALAAAGLSLRNERAIARARAAAIQFSREVSEGENQARRSMERAVRSVRGEDYETMLVREGLDMNAILLAIRPDERVKPEAAEGADAEDADGDGGKSAEPRGPLSPEELKQVEEAAQAAVERGAELVRQAREELAARSADAEGRKDTSAKDEERAKPEAAETDEDGGDGAGEGGGADASGGLVAAAFRKAIAEAGLTLDNAEAMVQLVKAITEKYLRDFPGEVADFDAADVWASPIARAKFAANLASFAEAVAAAYAPSHARIRIARKAQLLDGKGLTTMRQIEEVGEELFRDLHRDVIRQSRAGLMREIKKLVKPHATRYAENRLNQDREGGVESSVGRYCKFAWKAMRMTAEQCEARADELANELSAWGAMGEDEASRYRDYADKKMELDMITMYGDLKSRMPSELAEIRDFLEQTINESKWEMMEFGRKWEETANEAIEAISGAIVGNPKDNGVRPEDEEVSGLYSLIGMLETKAIQLTRWCRDAAKRAASLKAFGAVEEMIQRAEDVQYNYMQREKAKMVDLCKRTYGSESAAAAALSADVDEAAAARLNRGTQNTKWTVGRLMQMYASCVQSDYADNCAAWGRDGEYVRLLEETLLGMNPNHIEFIKGLREIYLQQGDALNEVLVRTTGTRLLTPNRLYMPVKMFRDTNLGENIRARAYSPFAPSLTPRVKNGLDFDQSADIMDVWQQRMEDAAHTIAWADTGSLVQRICQSNRVLRAIRDSHGRKVMRQWNSYVLDMLAGAEQGKVDSADWGVRFMRTMASLAAKTWLMLNPASWAKQLAAVPCFALSRDGTLRQVTKSMGFLAMHPFEAAKVMRDLSGTEAFRARYGTAINQELKYATSNRGRFGTWLDKLTDMGMAGITKFDQLGVYCLAGVYHDKRCELETQGKTAEEASELASAWLMHIVDKTAQTTRAVNTSQLQRAGGAWGLLLQFKSGPAQQMQFEAAAVQDALANPSDAARWRKAAAVIAINHVIVPTINTAIEGLLLFFTSWGVPDDEKRQRLLELWIANVISGSFGSIVFLGTAIEGVTSLIGQAATGQKVNARDALGDSLPASGVVNLYLNSGNKAIRAFMEMTDGDIEEGAYEMAKAIGAVIPGLSWATRKGFQAWESYQEKK